ncbi:DUF6756 family protein [Haloferula chungangensis]|uniref:DUF6756 family protein n=1 Tax=Haloferula chungangensis TaxID=1048331 RepID=A0ABW2LFV2_9BACT
MRNWVWRAFHHPLQGQTNKRRSEQKTTQQVGAGRRLSAALLKIRFGDSLPPTGLGSAASIHRRRLSSNVRQKMESPVLDELKAALANLELTDEQFEILPANRGRVIFDEMLQTFTNGVDCRWWWERFSSDSFSVTFEDGQSYTRICSIVPDPDQHVYFVVEDDRADFFPVCLTTPRIAQKVIGDCFGFEYYLVPKDRSWLLCENHHDAMIGIGEKITAQLRKQQAEQDGSRRRL